MFKALRVTLIITVLGVGYIALLLALFVPYLWLAYLAVGAVAAFRRPPLTSDAHGSARWANANPNDLEGLTDE